VALFFIPSPDMKAVKKYALEIFHLLVDSGSAFNEDNALKLSASLSYYTLFSMAPMLLIIISICSIFFGQEAVQGEVYRYITQWVGSEAALQIQTMIKNGRLSNQSWTVSTVGGIALLIGATGIFIEIQDSINLIWRVKPKPKRGWLKFLTNRAISFSLIVSLGFLMLVSLTLNTLFDLLFNRLEHMYPFFAVYGVYVFNLGIILLVITLLFAIVFKVLPDGEPHWKDAFVGAGFTAVLFLLGKFLIATYLSKVSVSTTYGSSGAIVIILLWVNYSSVILYFGAEFTKVYATRYGRPIIPDAYAVLVEHREIMIAKPVKTG
jgi:membrane protein